MEKQHSIKKDYNAMYNLIRKLDDLSSRNSIKCLVYASSIIFFLTLILLPPILGILENIGQVEAIFHEPRLLSSANAAIINSFIMAFTVATLDLVTALPLAWFIVRSRSKIVHFIDTLVDIPFLIPTAALGYSSLRFWSSKSGLPGIFGLETLISPGFTLVLLLHFAFSYPVIVRVMVGELLNYKEVYEVAARTLGASPFTAVRTITLPLLKPGIIASFLLAFARSLSETGATVMVAGPWENGPIFLFRVIDRTDIPAFLKNGILVYVSSILILTSTIIFFLIGLLAPKIKFPIRRVFPSIDRNLSRSEIIRFRNGLTLLIFLSIVVAPSIFIALPMINALLDGTLGDAVAGLGPWGEFWHGMLLSYIISLLSTLLNIIFGLPASILIARRKLGRATSIFKALTSVPIIVPSIALGTSLKLYWGRYPFIHEFWVLLFSHTTITYTYFVESMAAAIESIPLEIEEVASTLGAKPLTIFRKITLPLTKYSGFSGAVLVFTRALGETGAAKAAARSRESWTLPILLVDWIVNKRATESQSALGIGLYIISSFIILLVLRLLTRRK
ncbi:MAG: ABC transporter permease subunit [Candidatus Bathyarchaeia archaeon]|nr:iron ABC transporter permease [Candidatus Bathyarchaeota archaeon]